MKLESNLPYELLPHVLALRTYLKSNNLDEVKICGLIIKTIEERPIEKEFQNLYEENSLRNMMFILFTMIKQKNG